MMPRPGTCAARTDGPSASTIPARTSATEIHVSSATRRRIVSRTTGSTTTVMQNVNAPDATSKAFEPKR